MKPFFRVATWVFFICAILQGSALILVKGYVDYGWLGVVVLAVLGLPFGILLPVFGWIWFPVGQMLWLWFFIVCAMVCALLAKK